MSIRLPHSFLSLLNNSWVGGFLYQSRQLPPTIPNTMKYLLWKLRLLLKQIEDFRLFQCDVSVCTAYTTGRVSAEEGPWGSITRNSTSKVTFTLKESSKWEMGVLWPLQPTPMQN